MDNQPDLVQIGSMLFNGVAALLLQAGLNEDQIGTALAKAFGAPEEAPEQ